MKKYIAPILAVLAVVATYFILFRKDEAIEATLGTNSFYKLNSLEMNNLVNSNLMKGYDQKAVDWQTLNYSKLKFGLDFKRELHAMDILQSFFKGCNIYPSQRAIDTNTAAIQRYLDEYPRAQQCINKGEFLTNG